MTTFGRGTRACPQLPDVPPPIPSACRIIWRSLDGGPRDRAPSTTTVCRQPIFPSMESSLSSNRPSDRKFGLTFALVFFAASIYGIFKQWSPIIYALCALAAVCLVLFAWLAASRLRLLNGAWFALGELLGRVVSPIVLGLIFFVLITPISIIARLFGRDELRLKRRAVASYWVPRQTTHLEPNSFRQQF